MELAEIRPFEPQMAEIDLFTMPDAVGVGEPSVRKVKPYIAGHVTDGSSTFTFTVNGNESVTVPVDANGNWKWVVDRTLTSLASAFRDKTNIDSVTIKGFKTITNFYYTFYGCTNLQTVVILGDLSNVTTANRMFYNVSNNLHSIVISDSFAPTNTESMLFGVKTDNDNLLNKQWFRKTTTANRILMGTNVKVFDMSLNSVCTDYQYILQNNALVTTLRLGNIGANVPFICATLGAGNLTDVTIESTQSDMGFKSSAALTEQSVVNLFNAVAADGITLTFHATVYAMIEEQLAIEGSPIYEAYWNSDYDFNYASA